jgi:hypothetical protein
VERDRIRRVRRETKVKDVVKDRMAVITKDEVKHVIRVKGREAENE